jgi:hypothetical protein
MYVRYTFSILADSREKYGQNSELKITQTSTEVRGFQKC